MSLLTYLLAYSASNNKTNMVYGGDDTEMFSI